jgi:FSR family fosmidomycin resistance protein-like MFS transporter
MAGQVATAASIFFLFGQSGFALGPALGGLIVDHLDRSGILILTICAAPIGVFALRMLDPMRDPATTPPPVTRSATASTSAQANYSEFGLVLFVAAFGRWCELATATFMPKLLHDQGISATEYGIVVASFMGAGALGGVVGGILGDRWGRLRTVALAYGLSILPFFFFPNAHGLALFILAPLTGFLNGTPFSILVVTAQKALPGRGGLASGLTLGLMFAAGAVGSSISGWVADQIGIASALQMNALLSVIAVFGSVILASRRHRVAERVAPAAD